MRELAKTKSLCPECLKTIPAIIFERGGKVWIEKTCPKHGKFEDLYWASYELWEKARKFARDGKGIKNPNVKTKKPCPKNCGLCTNHLSHTCLGNIVVTNRCDLQCFYCFFYAKAMGYVYEPDLRTIRKMLRAMRREKPIPAKAVQLTGGEPLLREDIVEIIKLAKAEGFDHVQLNTNGIRLAFSQELAQEVRKAGVNTIYLSFDGLSPKTNPKNYWEIPLIFENCRKAGIGIVLVPTVVRGFNDKEVGKILKFGLKNIDIVRAINYQPVSLVGKMKKADVKKYRVTIPDVIKELEKIGIVTKEDFYPVPTPYSISRFVEVFTGKPQYYLTSHFACGMATYIFLDGNKPVPLPRFVDVEGLLEYLDEKADEIERGKNKWWVAAKVLFKLGSFIDRKKQPKDLNLAKMLFEILVKHNYDALRPWHHRSLFIGLMHFMDLWNYDLERVKRCCIHYAQPDGRIVPFCSFNVIPQWYRDKIQEKFSLPIKEWEKKTGRKLKEDFYRRDVKKLKKMVNYKKFYSVGG
jgi:hypothetical protein